MSTNNKPRSPLIFISHSVQDVDIIEPFVDFIRLGCDVSEKEIFCSSMHGIPNGEYFVKTIIDNLNICKVIICLISHDYIKSEFCLAELGCAQLLQQAAKRAHCFSLVVPPAGYGDLKGVLFGVQSGKIDSEDSLELFRTLIKEKIGKEATGPAWNRSRRKFSQALVPLTHSREMKQLVNNRLRVRKVEFERLTDDFIRKNKIVYIRKMRIIIQNMTGHDVNIKDVKLITESNDARLHPQPWYGLQKQLPEGKWAGDVKAPVSLKIGDSVRLGVAFDSIYRVEDLEQHWYNHELGVVTLQVEIGGTIVECTKRI